MGAFATYKVFAILRFNLDQPELVLHPGIGNEVGSFLNNWYFSFLVPRKIELIRFFMEVDAAAILRSPGEDCSRDYHFLNTHSRMDVECI